MSLKYLLIFSILIAGKSGFGQPVKSSLSYKTSTGHIIKVVKGQISYDNKRIFKIEDDDAIIYDSKSNGLIEDDGSVFLFVAMSGSPNRDRLNSFLVTSTKVTLVVDAILSPIKDYDGDGYLEFGGVDLTEMYPNPDSMYYIPSGYYEIRKGKIHPDYALTKQKDIKLNGLYLPPNKQLDKDGHCCKVIPTPGRKHKTNAKVNSGLIAKSFMGSDTLSVFATKYVLVDKDDITNAVHEKDGSWLFYSNDISYTPETAAKKVKLAAIIKLDRSVLLLSWMPKGYYAKRSSKTTPWAWNPLKYKE